MTLRTEVINTIEDKIGVAPTNVTGYQAIFTVNGHSLNIRTASDKNNGHYWFDVTPSYYETRVVDFFVYACGYAEEIYVFPLDDLKQMIQGASLGGQKQVPNFTIYPDTQELEPAGSSGHRFSISKFLNRFELLKKRP